MTATEAQVNEACERFMRDVLASQLRELVRMDMGHIPYAVKARRCLDLAQEASPRSRDRAVLCLVSPAPEPA